jgi:EAL domain-containing protein (putative c-di-GMP-specific phosphodiesterase class I)
MPGSFIPAAENTGLLEPLTMWVLKRAISQAAEWRKAGIPTPIAVNISPRSLLGSDLPTAIIGLLGDARLPADLLEIEVTESAIMVDPGGASKVLSELNAMGVRLSIDDFGAGYTSLAYLKSLPVHMLKIDRSFFDQITENERDQAVAEAVIALGHRLGLKVLAEGIETEEGWHLLRDLGCDQGQGFFLAPPMEGERFPRWAAAQEVAERASNVGLELVKVG